MTDKMDGYDKQSIEKGRKFEKYVEGLFHPLEFEILWKAPPFSLDNYSSSMDLPDFKILHRESGHQFWVEAKYRTNTLDNKVEWCSSKQFKKYNEFNKEHRNEKFFVIVGYKGEPDDPDKIYLFDLEDVEYNAIYRNRISKHEKDTRKLLKYDYGVLRQ